MVALTTAFILAMVMTLKKARRKYLIYYQFYCLYAANILLILAGIFIMFSVDGKYTIIALSFYH